MTQNKSLQSQYRVCVGTTGISGSLVLFIEHTERARKALGLVPLFQTEKGVRFNLSRFTADLCSVLHPQ